MTRMTSRPFSPNKRINSLSGHTQYRQSHGFPAHSIVPMSLVQRPTTSRRAGERGTRLLRPREQSSMQMEALLLLHLSFRLQWQSSQRACLMRCQSSLGHATRRGCPLEVHHSQRRSGESVISEISRKASSIEICSTSEVNLWSRAITCFETSL